MTQPATKRRDPLASIDTVLFVPGALVALGGYVVFSASVSAFLGKYSPEIDPDLALRAFHSAIWTIPVGIAGVLLAYAGNLIVHKRRLRFSLAALVFIDLLAVVAGLVTGNWVAAVYFGAVTGIIASLRGRFIS